MKNNNVIAVLSCLLILTSCGKDNSSDVIASKVTEIDYSKVKVERALMDQASFTFEELVDKAEIIMIAEVVDDGTPAVTFADEKKRKQLETANTLQNLKPIKVFKGRELIKGETVAAYNNYAFLTYSGGNTVLDLCTELAPLYKGDKAIFLLEYNQTMQRYIPIGTQGRFPLPEDIGKTDRLGFVNGLIDGVSLNEEYYKKLCEKYDIK